MSRPLQRSRSSGRRGRRVPSARSESRAESRCVLRRLPPVAYPEDAVRPGERGDCRSAPRPCPWVSCRYHLYLDVIPQTGSIKLNFPGLEPWDLRETCALDVADRGGITLKEVGLLLNLNRERIRQIEEEAIEKLRIVYGLLPQLPIPDTEVTSNPPTLTQESGDVTPVS